MKLYLFLPLLVAAAGFVAEPAVAQISHSGLGGGAHGGGHGGFTPSAGGGGRAAYLGGTRAANAGAARAQPATVRSWNGTAAARQVSGSQMRVSGHGRGHHHGYRPQHHGRPYYRAAPTYPQNFANHGYRANYNTPYYRQGFRQTNSPYGFAPVYRSPYSSYGAARPNQVMSYGTTGGFYPYTGSSGSRGYYGGGYSPYYQGPVYSGYRGYGVYGPHGQYTVPAGGTGTAAVQSQLLERGLYAGPVDGFAGPLTRAAIQRYQYMNGIPVTGRIDGYLVRSLRQQSFY